MFLLPRNLRYITLPSVITVIVFTAKGFILRELKNLFAIGLSLCLTIIKIICFSSDSRFDENKINLF